MKLKVHHRFHQILLVTSLLWLSWLAMMLVHEEGHVIGAFCTGGTVRQFVWHPFVLSRTDVQPNPHLLIEVWAGPAVGCLIPLILAGLASRLRATWAYLVRFFAGFCLIANGAYLGIGAIDPVGDAKQLLGPGAPRWTLIAFGLLTVSIGLWIWNEVSPQLGFGAGRVIVPPRHAYFVCCAAAIFTIISLVVGNRGG